MDFVKLYFDTLDNFLKSKKKYHANQDSWLPVTAVSKLEKAKQHSQYVFSFKDTCISYTGYRKGVEMHLGLLGLIISWTFK